MIVTSSHTLELIEKAQKDDEFAKEELINQNSPLIKSVIKRYMNKGIEYDDLYQLGSLGFLKAINNFDKNFNVKFSTYAVPMIAGEVKRFLRDNGVIKVSRSVKALAIKINKFIEEYVNKHEKSPNINEISEVFQVTPEEVVYAMESGQQVISLNTTIGDDEGKMLTLEDKVGEDSQIERTLDNMAIYKAIKELPIRERKIIILRYFRDKTQKEIAEIMGVSQVQISRIENKIIAKMREEIK